MTIKKYIDDIRASIAENDVGKSIQKLRSLLNNSPKLDEVIMQSSRFQDIRKQIRLGIVSNAEANLTQNQISTGLLDLLREIESQGEALLMRKELEQALSIINSKNVVVNPTISTNGNVEIGDRIIGINDVSGAGNINIQGGNYGPINNNIVVNNIPLPEKEKTAEEFYQDGIDYSNMNPPNLEKALSCFNRAITKKNGYVEAYLERGLLRMREKNYFFAIRDFKDALELSPKHCDAMYLLSVSFTHVNDNERAYNWIERSIEMGCNEKNHHIDDLYKKLLSKKKQ